MSVDVMQIQKADVMLAQTAAAIDHQLELRVAMKMRLGDRARRLVHQKTLRQAVVVPLVAGHVLAAPRRRADVIGQDVGLVVDRNLTPRVRHLVRRNMHGHDETPGCPLAFDGIA